MIFYNTGRTGTGKTQNAVILLIKFWKDGIDIWSNTPLFFTSFNLGIGGENILDDPEYFTNFEKYGFILRFILFKLRILKNLRVNSRGKIYYFDTIDETFHVKNSVIFFDEGQTFFRNYDYETVPKMFLHKLEQNRKDSNNLITTAQRPNAVNINYRYLVQVWNHFETIFDFLGFHVYKHKIKDIEATDENLTESEVPTLKMKGLFNFCIRPPWSKVYSMYDTYYNIGYEPIQHYSFKFGDQKLRFHLESGLKPDKMLSKLKTLNTLFQYA